MALAEPEATHLTRARPLVSVSHCGNNQAATIDKAVEGILGQTYDELELIVVGNGSTDETADVTSTYEADLVALQNGSRGNLGSRRVAAGSSTDALRCTTETWDGRSSGSPRSAFASA